LQGSVDQAVRTARLAVEDARAADHPPSLCWALLEGACPIALFTRDLTGLERSVSALLEHATRHALPVWHALGRCMQALLLVQRGDVDAVPRILRPAFDELQEVRFSLYTGFLGALAEGLGRAGRVAEGLATVDEAIARCDRTEERWSMAELLRVKGELFLRQDTSNGAVEEHFLGALDWARHQGALSWELRCATSLARLWQVQDRSLPARELLAPTLEQFTEGFKTADLTTARSLLDSLH
jgi:predicted ATPase